MVSAPDHPVVYCRADSITGGFASDAPGYAVPQHHLCNVTTGSVGELNLVPYLDWLDPDAYYYVTMEAQAAFVVQALADDTSAERGFFPC